ncbi:amidohydrolase family protein [Paracoccus sp. CPCC 101403]|uniref:Amidohydrolase family protein n=1 Tax=Paracoccus broussonetiae TaxID=3075834 RepID=A0ABU3EGQ5_9RHOB|nr:amidohydrolase family protein [Paracoccus sp. CPCC 101403]MDT1062630.1 amidohydrolase family protein [Paracoccus sp. CPCC 101403]
MTAAPFDLMLRNARPWGQAPCDIGIRDGRIAGLGTLAGADILTDDLGGRIVVPGFVEAHIHLDKAGLICRCGQAGGLREAVEEVSRLKREFTIEDVHARGARVVEAAIAQGTMRMRSHVEVDTRAGLRSFHAVRRLQQDYAFAMDIQICAFAQEGLTNDPEGKALLEQALTQGADLLGGCPYTDVDPVGQIEWLFGMAVRHDVDLDFHLDFDLDPGWTHMDAVCDATMRHGWQGRVTIGHATKLAVMEDDRIGHHAARLAEAGVAVVALPSTDLYLNGMDQGHRAPRGVAPVHLLAGAGVGVAVATNNVMNPFTPYGDCSLLRMANLYANIMHLGAADFPVCLDMVTHGPARMLGIRDYGLRIGDQADLVVLDADNLTEAFTGIALPVAGYKRGRKTFERSPAKLIRPKGDAVATVAGLPDC